MLSLVLSSVFLRNVHGLFLALLDATRDPLAILEILRASGEEY
jgi:hypothetical protein